MAVTEVGSRRGGYSGLCRCQFFLRPLMWVSIYASTLAMLGHCPSE